MAAELPALGLPPVHPLVVEADDVTGELRVVNHPEDHVILGCVVAGEDVEGAAKGPADAPGPAEVDVVGLVFGHGSEPSRRTAPVSSTSR